MPVIAIVGAGPGLGLSLAKTFGAQDFQVALISRSQQRLDGLVAQLDAAGIEAAAFPADVRDPTSLVEAFDGVTDRFDAVDVLEFSPAPYRPAPELAVADPLEVTVANLRPQIEYYLYGAVTAAQQVLPPMIDDEVGTLLFTTGAGSVTPHPRMGNVNAAAAALRSWVLDLNQVAAELGVYAAHVAINTGIGSGPPDAEADVIAKAYWDLYVRRDRAELVYTA
ncbi:SDR family NAD(P)-dependent oxidoreductase [Rhodococcus sp. X156]|uniref:SDR family NAD(P)-dependent oxidoreductase n=1 Tax=Rhodococcus sp. X156 TaxID=2499145 RepID=UPI000FD83860|nr:SDR family NAD(P)-dependent oxidoreductase [Rhodococcus sp. X156]